MRGSARHEGYRFRREMNDALITREGKPLMNGRG